MKAITLLIAFSGKLSYSIIIEKYTKGQLKGILGLFILLKNLYLIMSILLK